MKRKFLCLGLLCAMLLGCLPLIGAAAPLSPALAVLANNLSMSKCGLIGNEMTFYPEDFDRVADANVQSITVLTLPAPESGSLYLYEKPVEKFTEIQREEIEKLTFRTACDKEISCHFTFRVHTENEKYQAVCTLYMLDRLNFAPTVRLEDENGLSVGCSAYAGTVATGNIGFDDPESDSVFLRIVSYPKKGTVTLDGSEYRYIAFEGTAGEDSFAVVAIDRYGNRSEAVSVPVTVLARKSSLSYADMEDHDAYNAALTLSYNGALSGTVIGGQAVFRPDLPITRAEFVAALVTALGYEENTANSAVFADGDTVPDHLMPAISTACELGWIRSNAEAAFRPNEPINRMDASVILCRCMDLQLNPIPGIDADTQSLLVMAQMGILGFDNGSMSPDKALTRSDAALAICALLDRL